MNANINHNRTEWLIPAGLIMLSLVPVIAGSVRLTQLSTGADITPENARFFASPLPVVLHILSVTVFALLGAFQLAPRFRRRRRAWHRIAGRLVVVCGLIAAASGLWMTLFYPWPAGDGVILFGMRLLFGTAMLLAILLGVDAIRRRDFFEHGNWMIRAYAIGMGAGTQVFTHLFWFVLLGTPGEGARALLMGVGWVINVIVAEAIIRRRRIRTGRTGPPRHRLRAYGPARTGRL
ncbi:MAG: DUF2306 domain-containing protein [Caldilineaceae bacterium]|nr:DUF2306 domain-containing protein [Caldilineaceae bacterium]